LGGGATAPVRVGIADAGDNGAESFDVEADRSKRFENVGVDAAASLVPSLAVDEKFCEGNAKAGF